MNKVYIYIYAHISIYEGKQRRGAERRKESELIIL